MGLLRHVFDFVVRPTHSRTMGLLTLLTLVVAVFLTVAVAQQQQNITQQAEEQGRPTQIMSRVEIQPASLTTTVGTSSAIGMSALAYDVNDKPIWEEVSYNWGISSSNSIGILSPTTGNIANFRPLNAGSGDLFVHATFSNNTVVKSMLVTVGTKSPTPALPSATTPTKTLTPANVVGDINKDNFLDINDYNAILSCYGNKKDTFSCIYKSDADLNSDNNIDGIDYNLFLKSFSLTSRQGD